MSQLGWCGLSLESIHANIFPSASSAKNSPISVNSAASIPFNISSMLCYSGLKVGDQCGEVMHLSLYKTETIQQPSGFARRHIRLFVEIFIP